MTPYRSLQMCYHVQPPPLRKVHVGYLATSSEGCFVCKAEHALISPTESDRKQPEAYPEHSRYDFLFDHIKLYCGAQENPNRAQALSCHFQSLPNKENSPRMAKGKRILIRLMSEAGTGFYYVTSKNPKRTPDKLQLMKYDPVVKKHVLFSEQKFKK